MATAPTPAPKAAPVAAPAAPTPPAATPAVPAVQYIRAVYGRMVDPHTGAEYSQAPCKLFERTGWVDSQLDAKKMVLCDGPEVADES